MANFFKVRLAVSQIRKRALNNQGINLNRKLQERRLYVTHEVLSIIDVRSKIVDKMPRYQ